MADATIYLPLNAQQLVGLVKQLPQKQKQQLVNLLLEEDITISEAQKEVVRKRIKKYKTHTNKLISENDAWKLINARK